MRVTFTKRRYYRGWRQIGETVDVDERYARAFIRCRAARLATQPVTPAPEIGQVIEPAVEIEPEPEADARTESSESEVAPALLEGLTYRELQALCTKKGLPIYGRKADLLARLTEGG